MTTHNPKARLIINNKTISELMAARQHYLKSGNPWALTRCEEIAQDIARLEQENNDLVAQLAETRPLNF